MATESTGLRRRASHAPSELSALGMVNSLGADIATIWRRIIQGDQSSLVEDESLWPGHRVRVGRVDTRLPKVPERLGRYACRNNALALCALQQIEPAVRAAIQRHGPRRVGVVMGSSTSGVGATEGAYAAWLKDGRIPVEFSYSQHELAGLALFLAEYCGITGPAYTLSTACSSSAKAFASAQSLLDMDLCDAVLVGGVDSLCGLTVQGFASLQATTTEPCNPMSRNRRGFNVGEGAALFLLTRSDAGIQLLGVGESSDAHHMSAPDPIGAGAEAAMKAAFEDAGLAPADVAYINLHGTGTELNDRMESQAVARLLPTTPAGSTKSLVGHTLGAAGAMEVGFCWIALANPILGKVLLPPHLWDGQKDETFPVLSLVRLEQAVDACGHLVFMSNSFGFGGSNCSVLIGRRRW